MASLEVPSGWAQGRGAYGGYVVATLIRAIEQAVADPVRKVRSVTAELPGPLVPGSAELSVQVLRAGHSVSTVRAQLAQGGEIKSHAVAVLAAARPGAGPLAWQELVHPEVPSWKTLDPMPTLPTPEFAQHFEYRVVEGIPGSGPSAPARAVGWIRPRAPGGPRDAAHIAAVVDAWWPATLVRLDRPRPMATIAYTLDIVAGLDGLDPEAPLLYRGTVPVLADGYFLETRELWGEDGRLVALNQQTFVLIA
ncbi:MAG: thioesterase family protein [Myxococcales bacterium]|nr:thioesterase family protein [Myxococcales bacterium]